MNWQTGNPAKTGMYYVKLRSVDIMCTEFPSTRYLVEICTMPFHEKTGWLGDPNYSRKVSDRIIGWCPAEYIRRDV